MPPSTPIAVITVAYLTPGHATPRRTSLWGHFQETTPRTSPNRDTDTILAPKPDGLIHWRPGPAVGQDTSADHHGGRYITTPIPIPSLSPEKENITLLPTLAHSLVRPTVPPDQTPILNFAFASQTLPLKRYGTLDALASLWALLLKRCRQLDAWASLLFRVL